MITQKVIILKKYFNIFNIFLKKKVLVLLKITNLNKQAIKLQKNQQLLYKQIYSLSLVKLKILKIYIKINLANDFIQPLKSSASTFILFV